MLTFAVALLFWGCSKKIPLLDVETGKITPFIGSWKKILIEAKISVEKNPHDEEAFFNLGRALSNLGEWSAAQRAYSHSIRLQPKGAAGSCFYLAEAHQKLGHTKRAIRAYKRALHSNPSLDPKMHPKVRYRLALLYLHIRWPRLARQQYQILKTLDENLAKQLKKVLEENRT